MRLRERIAEELFYTAIAVYFFIAAAGIGITVAACVDTIMDGFTHHKGENNGHSFYKR